MVGQQHLLRQGSPLRVLAAYAGGGGGAVSVILWGLPARARPPSLVAATTENPSFSVVSPLTLAQLSDNDLAADSFGPIHHPENTVPLVRPHR